MTPRPFTDHVTRGIARLREQYKGKPNITAVLRSVLTKVQQLENAIWSIALMRLFGNAGGSVLDKIGDLVGQERVSDDDDLYTQWIMARILINTSAGRIKDFYALLEVLYPDAEFRVYDLPPAHVRVESLSAGVSHAALFALLNALRQTKAGGIGLVYEYGADDQGLRVQYSDGEDEYGISYDDDTVFGLISGMMQ